MRARVLLSVLLCWLGCGCAAGMAGAIPPAAFQFHKVVPQGGSEAGGWKVAQTTITLTRVSSSNPVQANCQVEIGVPMVNGKGIVPDVVAQEAAATAADEAARLALAKRPVTSAELCLLFEEQMKRLLKEQISGVRVRRFIETGIPQNKFVPE